ncbi:hypothetical protein ACQ4PT_035817 [Festuca glaucescens]
MEGCVPSNRIYKFREQLKEGSIYSLESFIVAAAWNKYETTNHPYRIKIIQRTKVIKAIPEPEIFSRFAYNVKSFDVLQSRTGDNTVLSDVAGLMMIVNGYRSVEYESRAKVAYSLIGIARCW